MKQPTLISYLLLSIFILSGCASSLPYVQNYTIPFERKDYSILPPEGSGWMFSEQNNSIIFGKRDGATHTYTAQISETQSYSKPSFDSREDFLKFVKNNMNLGTDPNRFAIVEEETILDNRFGQYCARFYNKSEDRYAAEKNKVHFMIMETYGYVFINPSNAGNLINIYYSERGTLNENSSNLKEIAEKFITGFKLKSN